MKLSNLLFFAPLFIILGILLFLLVRDSWRGDEAAQSVLIAIVVAWIIGGWGILYLWLSSIGL